MEVETGWNGPGGRDTRQGLDKKLRRNTVHSSLSAIIRQHCDPVVVAMDVCAR